MAASSANRVFFHVQKSKTEILQMVYRHMRKSIQSIEDTIALRMICAEWRRMVHVVIFAFSLFLMFDVRFYISIHFRSVYLRMGKKREGFPGGCAWGRKYFSLLALYVLPFCGSTASRPL